MDPRKTTETVLRCAKGDAKAAEELMPLVYDELRSLAARYMKRERAGHTLQATALVNEAYLRMLEVDRIDWQGKTHFFAVAARQMRRILIDHANAKNAQKRGGGIPPVELSEQIVASPNDPVTWIALDGALGSLTELHARQARVAEMRLFAGMQVEEIAHVLEVSPRTVKGDWRFARVWLMRALGDRRAER